MLYVFLNTMTPVCLLGAVDTVTVISVTR